MDPEPQELSGVTQPQTPVWRNLDGTLTLLYMCAKCFYLIEQLMIVPK